MHLIVALRGIKHAQDMLIEELSHKWLSHKLRVNQKTKQIVQDPFDTKHPIQEVPTKIAMRPLRLYEIIIPEEHKDLILNTLWPPEAECTDGYFGNVWGKKFNWIIERIRKMLGLQPIPTDFDKSKKLILDAAHVEIIGIGLKEDQKINGIEML